MMAALDDRGGRRRREETKEPPIIHGRVPPHDLDAEAAVLASCLLAEDSAAEQFDAVATILETSEPFYSDAHRLIYDAILDLRGKGQPTDIVTVNAWLRDRQFAARAGAPKYLGELVDATPAVARAEVYALIVLDKWRIRRGISACQRFAAEGYGHAGEAQEYLDDVESTIYALAHIAQANGAAALKVVLTDTFTTLAEAAKRGDHITGIPTRFTDLDKKTAGLHRGDLTIVAGRPGMGKSAFVTGVSVNVASPSQRSVIGDDNREHMVNEPGLGVAIFSLEMPREQIAQRMVCSEARVDLSKMRQGYLTHDDWANLTSAAATLAALPIMIDDMPGLTVLSLRSRVRRIFADWRRPTPERPEGVQPGLVVIDYMQLMSGRKGAPNREQEVSEISRGLKELAKELRVPVIALSQLNRGVETRAKNDKRPMLADLRESGSIEQDSDNIIFIYRDEYYNRETTNDKGIAELILAKQRNGPTGTVRTRFVSSCTRFENLAPGEYGDFEDYEQLEMGT